MTTLCTYSIHLSASDLLSSTISNTDKHESSVWKWFSCCNDIMNHVDCIIKRGISKKNIMGDIAWIFA